MSITPPNILTLGAQELPQKGGSWGYIFFVVKNRKFDPRVKSNDPNLIYLMI